MSYKILIEKKIKLHQNKYNYHIKLINLWTKLIFLNIIMELCNYINDSFFIRTKNESKCVL